MTLPKTTRRVGVTHRAKGRTLAIKPQRDYALTDAEREANDLCILADAELLARKLCGDALYCREEVKGWRIAALIRTLARVLRRVVDAKSTARMRELERENAALREELAVCRREMQRWGLAYPGTGEKQRELPFGLDAPA